MSCFESPLTDISEAAEEKCENSLTIIFILIVGIISLFLVVVVHLNICTQGSSCFDDYDKRFNEA